MDATAALQAINRRLDDLAHDVRSARDFAEGANKKAGEARDSSRENAQTLAQVVVPKLTKVDEHEAALQRTNGALWAFGAVGTVLAIFLAVLALR